MKHAPKRHLGVFTSVAIRDGKPVLLDRHLRRLAHSCVEIYGDVLPEGLARKVRAAARSQGDSSRIRAEVVPSASGLEATVVVGPMPGGPRSIAIDSVVIKDWQGGHKWIDRSMLPARRVLVIDEVQRVLEIDNASVFTVVNGRIATPPVDGRILPGVARSLIVGLHSVSEERLSLPDLLVADEVFATNSLRGVIPVIRCDDRRWDVPGPITTQLALDWESELRSEVAD